MLHLAAIFLKNLSQNIEHKMEHFKFLLKYLPETISAETLTYS